MKYIFTILLIALATLLSGCEYFPESSFKLSNESRIPKWFELPENISRSDIEVVMNYYVKPWGRTAEFILKNKSNEVLDEVKGSQKGSGPQRPHGGKYPSYEIITVNEITEVIQHRKMEPIFYIVDDSETLKMLGVNRANPYQAPGGQGQKNP